MRKNLLPFLHLRRPLFQSPLCKRLLLGAAVAGFALTSQTVSAQTAAFPGAMGFGKYARGARGAATQEVYIVTNLNDSGAGSFRDAVSKPGRIVVFAVGGIVRLNTDVVVSPNITIAGQTAPGDGIVFFNKRVTFSAASNTIARYLRVRLGATGNSGNDASGLASGANMIFDHMSFSWAMDEVFSINWDGKGTAPDNITLQNCIIGQGLFRENHSAGGLIQTPDGGRVSLLQNLYISNKTRNPKVKGVNEFVNNVVYDWGNGGRLDQDFNYPWAGDAYIMGGSSGVSEVNIINNYFVGGPLTPASKTTGFSRGTGTFSLYGSGNYFDNNKNGVLDGTLIPYEDSANGYPGISDFKTEPFAYPTAVAKYSAEEAYQVIIDSVGASYPRRDPVDALMVDEVKSKGTKGLYIYRETDTQLPNGGLGNVFGAPAPLDSDADGMPDAWEDANGLNKNLKADAIAYNTVHPEYLNIEVYINSLVDTPPQVFVKPPSGVNLTASTQELPSPSSSVLVKWTDNSDNELNFVLERSNDGTVYTDIFHPAADAVSYTDNDLLPNTTYYYRLKAVTASEESSYSAVVSVKTPAIPSAPTAPTAPIPANGYQYGELSAGAITLKWSGSSNTTTYSVYFGTDAASLTKKADLAYAASPSYSVSSLLNNTTYYWRVDATNAKGTVEGTVWSFRTRPYFPSDLAGHWAFDETLEDGNVVTDSSSFANNGILGLDEDNQSIRVAGKVKNAMDFSTASTNMYVVSIPHKDHLFLDKGSFSLSFWMKAGASLLPQNNNTSAYLLCKGSITKNATTGATGKRFDIEFKNKQLRFAIDDDNDAGGGGKDELQTDGTPFFVNEWVHVVAIRDSSNKKLQVYLNGVLTKEQAITKALSGIGEASSLVIGNIGELEFLSTANPPAPYKGMLDELKVFNYALTPPQVMQQYYTSPLPIQAYTPFPANGSSTDDAVKSTVTWLGGINTTHYKVYLGTDKAALAYQADVPLNTPTYQFTNLLPNTTYYWRIDAVGAKGTTSGDVWSFTSAFPLGLVGDWRMDASTGTTISDNSTYQNHGLLNNISDYAWEAGRVNNSLNLKTVNTNSGISIPHQDQIKFDKNSFSISMWIKGGAPSSSSVSSYLLHKGTFLKNTATGATGKWYGVEFKNNLIYWNIDDDATKSQVSVSSADFLNSSWVNVIFVRDVPNKLIKIYRNGTLAASATETTGTSNGIGSIDPLVIGNTTLLDAPFKGAIDEVKFYNYPLSGTEISTLAGGNDLSVLPVNLTRFTASAEANKVKLEWSTASEPNNDRFLLEKSVDGKEFSVLNTVKASGTSNKGSKYVSYDFSPVAGTNYYKLSQFDVNGKSEVLDIRSVKFGLDGMKLLEVYPNPASQFIHLRIPGFEGSVVTVSVSSLDGRVLLKEEVKADSLDNTYTLRLKNKPATGAYVLKVSGSGLNENTIVLIK